MCKKITSYLKLLIQATENSNTVYCIGHDQIDVDSFFGGLLASRLLNFLGINSKFCILQPVKHEETYNLIKEVTGIDISNYELTFEDSNRALLLIDHYETPHAGFVVGCIDHHPTNKEISYPFHYIKNASAATYIIYELMKSANYSISAEEAKYIVFSMLVDTLAFRSSKTITAEVKIAKELSKEFNLDYDYLEKKAFCITPIEKMTIEEIILNGLKNYTYSGYKVASSYVQLYEMPAEKIVDKWLKQIKDYQLQNSIHLFVFIIFDVLNSQTFEYQISRNNHKKIIHNGILSRGKNIMPKVEREFTEKFN